MRVPTWWAGFVLQKDTKGHRNMGLEEIAAQNRGDALVRMKAAENV